MSGREWDDYLPMGIGAFLVLLVGLVIWAACAEDRQVAAACAKMWALTRNSSDSLHVVEACEKPHYSAVMPVVVPMPAYR